MVAIEVHVAKADDQLARAKLHHLGDHMDEQGVARDIEGYAQEDIGAALVEVAGQSSLGHIELEQQMAGRQRHVLQLRHVPGTDHMTPAVGVAAQLLQDLPELVDGAAVWARPGAPLAAIDGPQLASGIGPFIPDVDAGLLERPDVGLAAQEPQQLMDDTTKKDLLGGEQGKALL